MQELYTENSVLLTTAILTLAPGTRLSLYIALKYAGLMNGKVECNSELDMGTAFIVTLNTNND